MRTNLGKTWPVLVVLCGCGGSSDLEADNVRTWATTGSAVGIYANLYEPVAFADGQAPFADPACPVTSDDGTTVQIAGGCVDQDGKQWSGSVTIESTDNGDRNLTFVDYGGAKDQEPATLRGTASILALANGQHQFEVDLVHEGGMTTHMTYTGRVEGTYDGPSTWNGSGQVDRDGLVAPTGTVDVTTVDEVIDDDVCTGQPASGRTTISTEEDDAVVTYDGATDCDDEHDAEWSLNGKAQGRLTDISCAVGTPGRSSATSGALLLGAIGLVLARRRRSA